MTCGNDAWSARLRVPSQDLVASGRICVQGRCEEVSLFLDSGWLATDIAVHSHLVGHFSFQPNLIEEESGGGLNVENVTGSAGEDLPTYFPNARVYIFLETPDGRKRALSAMAGRISGLSEQVERLVASSQGRFAIAGPSMLKAWRLSMDFQEKGTGVLHRCPPTIQEALRTWGAFRDTVDGLSCSDAVPAVPAPPVSLSGGHAGTGVAGEVGATAAGTKSEL